MENVATENTTVVGVETSRVRMNIKTTAKGETQMDITVEFPNTQDAAKNLDEAIKQWREVIAQNGLHEAGRE